MAVIRFRVDFNGIPVTVVSMDAVQGTFVGGGGNFPFQINRLKYVVKMFPVGHLQSDDGDFVCL